MICQKFFCVINALALFTKPGILNSLSTTKRNKTLQFITKYKTYYTQ